MRSSDKRKREAARVSTASRKSGEHGTILCAQNIFSVYTPCCLASQRQTRVTARITDAVEAVLLHCRGSAKMRIAE